MSAAPLLPSLPRELLFQPPPRDEENIIRCALIRAPSSAARKRSRGGGDADDCAAQPDIEDTLLHNAIIRYQDYQREEQGAGAGAGGKAVAAAAPRVACDILEYDPSRHRQFVALLRRRRYGAIVSRVSAQRLLASAASFAASAAHGTTARRLRAAAAARRGQAGTRLAYVFLSFLSKKTRKFLPVFGPGSPKKTRNPAPGPARLDSPCFSVPGVLSRAPESPTSRFSIF